MLSREVSNTFSILFFYFFVFILWYKTHTYFTYSTLCIASIRRAITFIPCWITLVCPLWLLRVVEVREKVIRTRASSSKRSLFLFLLSLDRSACSSCVWTLFRCRRIASDRQAVVARCGVVSLLFIVVCSLLACVRTIVCSCRCASAAQSHQHHHRPATNDDLRWSNSQHILSLSRNQTSTRFLWATVRLSWVGWYNLISVCVCVCVCV